MSLFCFGSFRQRQKKQMDFQNSRVFFPEELVTVNRSLVSADFLYLPLEAGFRDKTEHSMLRRKGSMVITRTSVSLTTLPTKQTPTQQRSTSAEARDIETNLEIHGPISSEFKNINSSADSIDSGALTSSSTSLSCFHHLEANTGLHRSNTVDLSCPLHHQPLYRLYPRLQEQRQQQKQQQQQQQSQQEQALMSRKDESMMRCSLQMPRTKIRTNPWVHPPPLKQPSLDSNHRNNVDSLQRQNNNDICRSGPSNVATGQKILCVRS